MRDEVAGLYANRAQTNMSQRKWVEGLADARSSTECKKGGNAKAWWRGGKCLCEMGRFEEAGKFIEGGLEVESGEKELLELKRECERRVEERRMKM